MRLSAATLARLFPGQTPGGALVIHARDVAQEDAESQARLALSTEESLQNAIHHSSGAQTQEFEKQSDQIASIYRSAATGKSVPAATLEKVKQVSASVTEYTQKQAHDKAQQDRLSGTLGTAAQLLEKARITGNYQYFYHEHPIVDFSLLTPQESAMFQGARSKVKTANSYARTKSVVGTASLGFGALAPLVNSIGQLAIGLSSPGKFSASDFGKTYGESLATKFTGGFYDVSRGKATENLKTVATGGVVNVQTGALSQGYASLLGTAKTLGSKLADQGGKLLKNLSTKGNLSGRDNVNAPEATLTLGNEWESPARADPGGLTAKELAPFMRADPGPLTTLDLGVFR